MSNKLLIFIGQNQTFNLNAVDHVLTSLEDWSVERLGGGIGAIQQYLCIDGTNELIVRISLDFETITIGPHLDHASAKLALSIQAGLSLPLRIIDMGYNFDLVIGDYATPEDLLLAACA